MKLRSHEILSAGKKPISSSSSNHPSRLKKLFQPKNLFKKKFQQQSNHQNGIAQAIPDYVRKSIFRFLLEVKHQQHPTPPSPPPSPPPQTPIRRPPLMGIQALKNKKQHLYNQPKRSLRIKYCLI